MKLGTSGFVWEADRAGAREAALVSGLSNSANTSDLVTHASAKQKRCRSLLFKRDESGGHLSRNLNASAVSAPQLRTHSAPARLLPLPRIVFKSALALGKAFEFLYGLQLHPIWRRYPVESLRTASLRTPKISGSLSHVSITRSFETAPVEIILPQEPSWPGAH
jgi:hypothetical protein